MICGVGYQERLRIFYVRTLVGLQPTQKYMLDVAVNGGTGDQGGVQPL